MAAILNLKMAATRACEYVGEIFFQLPSLPLGGSTLCKVSCLLHKLNDSGALPLYYAGFGKSAGFRPELKSGTALV